MIKKRKLDCGITLVSEKMPNMKSVTIGIWVKAGAVDEKPEEAGISHFIEHMMFKGTAKRTAKQLAEDVDKMGGQINAFTGKEATCYYIKSLASSLENSMEILFDMFLDSEFNSGEMEREKKVIYEEMKMIQDTPDEDAHDSICELVFKGDCFGKSIIGTEDTVGSISRDGIKDYLNRQYTKDSIVIAVAGNFNEEKIKDMIEGQLEKLPAIKEPVDCSKPEYKSLFQVKVKEIEQTHLCLGTRSIDLLDPDYYSFALLNNIMGSSMSSRFFQNIREEKGLAYSVYSINNAFSSDGYYNIYAGVSHDKVEETINAIKEELIVLKKDGVTTEELAKAKEQLKSAYVFGQENVNGRMFSIGKSMALLDKIISPEKVIKDIDKVKLEDLERVKDYICHIDKYSAVAITNKEINLEGIIKN